MKRIFCLLALAVLLGGQSTPVTLADISGDGMVHSIAASGSARWITFTAPLTNATTTCSSTSIAGCPRIGDLNISTSRGHPMMPGEIFGLWESSGTIRHSLSGWCYLVQSGDKISIIYGQ